jgi:predicted nucleic acid-binding protein
MNYLLPARTLLDLCDVRPNAAHAWAASVNTASVRVSVISVAEAQAAVGTVTDAQSRLRLEANLLALLCSLEADSEAPLPFDAGHASIWKVLVHDATLRGLGATDRQVYATAMQDGLAVVEAAGPHTQALQALGVSIRLL